ncbi:WD40-repeat-containing domain protein [Bombardia bombarda]|uniref:Mitochondrial division protein 1 n=1 Tax=Bombardia bombarda TaxID=252184 RepID=A0AA39WNE7_9PEZI|nr:WD40-repeat-containing domain protein [Bombardia bombarda]
MSELASAAQAAALVEPPFKRRRVHDDSIASTPRYGSPDKKNSSILRSRPRSRCPSGSKTPPLLDGDEKDLRYGTSTPSSSQGSRSRSPLRSREPSYSHSPSQSRSLTRSPRSTSRSPIPSSPRSRSRSPSTPSRRSPDSQEVPSRRLSLSASGLPAPATAAARRQPPTPQFRRRLELRGHTAAISQVRISPDGRWIASSSADGSVMIWDADTGAHLDTLVGHMAGVSCVAWAPDSDTLATGSDDKAIRLWDRVTASPVHVCSDGAGGRAAGGGIRAKTMRGGWTGRGGPLLGHHNYVYCLAFSPKGNILASGSYDEAVFLWDVRAGRLMRSLPAHSDPVSGIDFCRDGTLVVSCSTDGLIRIWDTQTGQCLRTLVHEDKFPVSHVCFSPNGRFVLAFSLDDSIRLWDYITYVSGSVKKTYEGHTNHGYSIGGCFGVLRENDDEGVNDSSGGDKTQVRSFVASASEDGDIVLWDVDSKQVIQRIARAHKGGCFWVDVNGATMVSAGEDGVVRVYRNTTPRERYSMEGGPSNLDGANELNGREEEEEGSTTPYAVTADEELQRQVEADAASPMQIVKEEQP